MCPPPAPKPLGGVRGEGGSVTPSLSLITSNPPPAHFVLHVLTEWCMFACGCVFVCECVESGVRACVREGGLMEQTRFGECGGGKWGLYLVDLPSPKGPFSVDRVSGLYVLIYPYR